MTKFNQWAVVHVPDKDSRKELMKWMSEVLGYIEDKYSKQTNEYVCAAGKGIVTFRSLCVCPPGAIFCGTNIPMFKALAAIREDSDYMQWFVCQRTEYCPKSLIQCTIPSITGWYHLRWYYLCRKATPDEIVEHFKEKE